jgi:hypothetical protein
MICVALPQKSERSADGAIYKSPGQARSEAERVAPGLLGAREIEA